MIDARDSLFEQLSGVNVDADEDEEEPSADTDGARSQKLRERRSHIEHALRRLEDQRRSAQDLQRTRSLKREMESRERDEVATGKRPFFQKKCMCSI